MLVITQILALDCQHTSYVNQQQVNYCSSKNVLINEKVRESINFSNTEGIQSYFLDLRVLSYSLINLTVTAQSQQQFSLASSFNGNEMINVQIQVQQSANSASFTVLSPYVINLKDIKNCKFNISAKADTIYGLAQSIKSILRIYNSILNYNLESTQKTYIISNSLNFITINNSVISGKSISQYNYLIGQLQQSSQALDSIFNIQLISTSTGNSSVPGLIETSNSSYLNFQFDGCKGNMTGYFNLSQSSIVIYQTSVLNKIQYTSLDQIQEIDYNNTEINITTTVNTTGSKLFQVNNIMYNINVTSIITLEDSIQFQLFEQQDALKIINCNFTTQITPGSSCSFSILKQTSTGQLQINNSYISTQTEGIFDSYYGIGQTYSDVVIQSSQINMTTTSTTIYGLFQTTNVLTIQQSQLTLQLSSETMNSGSLLVGTLSNSSVVTNTSISYSGYLVYINQTTNNQSISSVGSTSYTRRQISITSSSSQEYLLATSNYYNNTYIQLTNVSFSQTGNRSFSVFQEQGFFYNIRLDGSLTSVAGQGTLQILLPTAQQLTIEKLNTTITLITNQTQDVAGLVGTVENVTVKELNASIIVQQAKSDVGGLFLKVQGGNTTVEDSSVTFTLQTGIQNNVGGLVCNISSGASFTISNISAKLQFPSTQEADVIGTLICNNEGTFTVEDLQGSSQTTGATTSCPCATGICSDLSELCGAQETSIVISDFPYSENSGSNYYAVNTSSYYNNSLLSISWSVGEKLNHTHQSIFQAKSSFIGVTIVSSEHSQTGNSNTGLSLIMGMISSCQIINCDIEFIQSIGSSNFTGLFQSIGENVTIENLTVQGSVQAQNGNFLCYELTGEDISLTNITLSGSFTVQGNSFVLYEYAEQVSLTVEGLTTDVNINSQSTGEIGYCGYTGQTDILMAEISLSGNLVGSDGNASIFISVSGNSSLGITNMSSQEMSIQSTKIVCGLVANLTQSDLDIEGITLTTTIISQHWSTAVFVVFSDSGSTITSSNVSYSTNSKTYGACPVSTVSEQSLTADSYTCPEFVSYTETRDYSDLSGSECENCNETSGRYQHYVYTADENVDFNDTIFTHFNNTDVLLNEYPTTDIMTAPFDHTFFGTWLQNLLINGERAYDADFSNHDRDNHASSLFAGLQDGTTTLINVTTNDTVYEKYRPTSSHLELRYKGAVSEVKNSQQKLYFVGCHINTTIRQNENTSGGGIYNWGGSIGYDSGNGNVYFINHRIGLSLENKRGSINFYALGYRLTSTYCHSYGGFTEDEWAYENLKVASSSSSSYTSACPEEDISYFL